MADKSKFYAGLDAGPGILPSNNDSFAAFNEDWYYNLYTVNNTTVNSVGNSILNVTSTTNDAGINMYNIMSANPYIYKYVEIRYRVTAGTAGSVQIYYTNTRSTTATGDQVVSAGLISDGNWYILDIAMSSATYWTDSNILGWRYDWCTGNGCTMEIDYIRLQKTSNPNNVPLYQYAKNSFKQFQVMLRKSTEGNSIFSTNIVSTYSLVYTASNAYSGGVLAPNGDIHFVPYSANRGQKIAINGVVSTYSLVYTTTNAYFGGVLAPNGDIYMIPYDANRGQKIDTSGVVSTYSLVYTTSGGAYFGGILAPNGDIHMIPYSANCGQKIDTSGVVSTYSLVYTATQSYSGGVLAPNGDIHMIPYSANCGQKIDINGVVSTYSIAYNSYNGGVLAPNNDIHMSQVLADRGQKIDSSGVISTYTLVYTSNGGYCGGVLAPNGDIHFIPRSANRGQKIDIDGVVSTYSLVYAVLNAYFGGILAPNGDIHFIPRSANRGQKISTLPAIPFSLAVCCSPFFNKY